MPSPNREACRDLLATLISTNMGPTGDGLVTAVLNYSTTDLKGKTPVVMVMSDGTNRPGREGFGADSAFTMEVRLRVVVFVALPGPDDTAYTHEMAEDLLDKIDQRLADLVIAEEDTVAWWSLEYEPGFSEPRDVKLAGDMPYIMEPFSLVAKVR